MMVVSRRSPNAPIFHRERRAAAQRRETIAAAGGLSLRSGCGKASSVVTEESARNLSGSYDLTGRPRTFYSPEHGPNYWQRQVGQPYQVLPDGRLQPVATP